MEMNILITNEAKKELDKLLEQSDKKCIRICTRCITMTSDAKIDLELDNPNADDNIFRSLHNVNMATMPGWRDSDSGDKHSFIEKY